MSSLRPLFFFALLAFAASALNAQSTWVDRTASFGSSSNNNNGIAYNGSRFLVVTSSSAGTYWRSAAGTSNWTSSSLPTLPLSYSSSGIAFGNGVTVVSGVKNTLHTTIAADPVTADWTKLNPAVRPSGTPDLYRVRYLNGLFVVGTSSYFDSVTNANSYTEVLTSPDGVTWTSRKFSYTSLTNTVQNIRDIAFKPGATAGTGTWVFGTAGNFVLTAPENFSSVTRVSIASLGTGPSLTYGAGLFVLTTNNGKIFTSPTGATWTQRTLPVTTAELGDVHFDGTTFVAVGGTVSGSSPSRPTILTSADAATWTEVTAVPSTTRSLFCALKADGLWLTGGDVRTFFTSGNSSVSAPGFSPQPAAFFGSTGGTITLSATATGTPASTVQWYRGTTALINDARISGATTATLTITGATFADAGSYFLRATNTVGSTDSSPATVSLNATAGGAVFSPYGVANTLGGDLIFGASPAQTAVSSIPSLFTIGTGITSLPNTTFGGTSYTRLGGVSPDGTLLVLNPATGNKPPILYTLATSTATPLAAFPLPFGTITSLNYIGASGLSNGGDVCGSINDQADNLHAFHYSATTQTYTLLGLVPNTTNDRATSTGGISADGTTVSGYERISTFNGPFLWTTTGGFTLLPQPANGGVVDRDIREISPNARFIVGQGTTAFALGSGTTAMRWDRGTPAGAPVGYALPRGPGDFYADARTVNDDGTVAGNVRDLTKESAAVWLPSGALINLPNYLATTYGLTTPGYVLNQATSISNDLRTIAGTATNSAGLAEGWILTLPAPLSIASTPQNISVRRATTDLASGATVPFGSYEVAALGYFQHLIYIRNDGTTSLADLSATITGTDAVDFTYVLASGLSGPLPASLGLNEFVTLYVRFAPLSGAAGPRTATLTITSNDPDTSSIVINLSGTATAPAVTPFLTYLTNASVPSNQRGATDDPDFDGISNLLEFALGLAPMTPDATGLPVAQRVGGDLTFTYTRAQPSGITYSVQTSTHLTPNSWTVTGVTQGIPDVNGVTTATIPLDTPGRYLRLSVTLAP